MEIQACRYSPHAVPYPTLLCLHQLLEENGAPREKIQLNNQIGQVLGYRRDIGVRRLIPIGCGTEPEKQGTYVFYRIW